MFRFQAVLNNGDIVKSMLAVEEVDLSLEDNQGKTALDWARDKSWAGPRSSPFGSKIINLGIHL